MWLLNRQTEGELQAEINRPCKCPPVLYADQKGDDSDFISSIYTLWVAGNKVEKYYKSTLNLFIYFIAIIIIFGHVLKSIFLLRLHFTKSMYSEGVGAL